MFKLNCIHHAFPKKVFYFNELQNAQDFAEKLEHDYNKEQNRPHVTLTWTENRELEYNYEARGFYAAYYFIDLIITED